MEMKGKWWAMSEKAQEIIYMLDMLPEDDQSLIYELIKKFVLAWDPDLTKVTPSERIALERAQLEIENGEYYLDSEIEWDNLDKMDLG